MAKQHTLPENFQLPTAEDYDTVVARLDEAVQEEGSARLFLGKIRHERRNGYSFQMRTLQPLARTALSLEEMDERGLSLDRDHSMANAALAGMVYGHLANEASYPLVGELHHPYDPISVTLSMLGGAEASFLKNEGMRTPFGRQIGYTAMAGYVLRQLSEQSRHVVHGWSEEVIYPSVHHKSFVYGFGTALYAAWDLYSDKLIAEGRADEVALVHESPQIDGGES